MAGLFYGLIIGLAFGLVKLITTEAARTHDETKSGNTRF